MNHHHVHMDISFVVLYKGIHLGHSLCLHGISDAILTGTKKKLRVEVRFYILTLGTFRLYTYIISEHHTKFPYLVLHVNGAQPKRMKRSRQSRCSHPLFCSNNMSQAFQVDPHCHLLAVAPCLPVSPLNWWSVEEAEVTGSLTNLQG